jgi:hypothetical protein
VRKTALAFHTPPRWPQTWQISGERIKVIGRWQCDAQVCYANGMRKIAVVKTLRNRGRRHIEVPVEVVAIATIDNADYGLVSDYTWYLSAGYAVSYDDGRRVFMHRLIAGLRDGDLRETDHKNGNTLDNRRKNLRVVTHAENQQNRKPSLTYAKRPVASVHRGVYLDPRTSKWVARCTVAGKRFFLGSFEDEDEAAAAATQFRKQHMPYSRV